MRVWLLLAGEFSSPDWTIEKEDVVIAVDGGMAHAQALNCTPHLWLGDFDSATMSADTAIPRLDFPQDKDQTDFELALDYAHRHYPEAILCVIGSGGGEADHAFANLWVLARYAQPVILWQKQTTVVYLPGGNLHFSAPVGAVVSLFALTPLTGIRNHGLKWPLKNAELAPFSALAARNQIVLSSASMSWLSGDGLVFLPVPCTLSLD